MRKNANNTGAHLHFAKKSTTKMLKNQTNKLNTIGAKCIDCILKYMKKTKLANDVLQEFCELLTH